MHSPSPDGRSLVIGPLVGFLPFQVVTIITLTAGTCFVMWLGEQITERGIGNGSSLIIFTGIAASIPSGAQRLYELVASNDMKFIVALVLLAFMVLIVGGVIFMETAMRKIQVQYSQRAAGGMPVATNDRYLPIKINFSVLFRQFLQVHC